MRRSNLFLIFFLPVLLLCPVLASAADKVDKKETWRGASLPAKWGFVDKTGKLVLNRIPVTWIQTKIQILDQLELLPFGSLPSVALPSRRVLKILTWDLINEILLLRALRAAEVGKQRNGMLATIGGKSANSR
jgi:hypothetical protein